jgi:spore coat polysaccharide biosynthesis protein SpsF
MSAKIMAVIQARMTSSRLPGKVMLDIAGKQMLQLMLDQVRKAKSLDDVIVATTTDPSDDILEQFCQERNIPYHRGNLQDVLDRFYQAANKFRADVIVRLTADCPLIDPQVLDRTVSTFLGNISSQAPVPDSLIPDPLESFHPAPGAFDFAANRLPPPWKRTLPIGLDVEVCSFESLQRAWKESDQPFQREHVLPYLYEDVSLSRSNPPLDSGWYVQTGRNPRGFRVALLNHSPDYGAMRWTVDTPADLEFVRQVYARLAGHTDFTWMDVLSILENEPELTSINAGVQHKSAFDVDHRTDH